MDMRTPLGRQMDARADHHGSVRVGTLLPLADILSGLGVEPTQLLAECGVDPSVFDDPDNRISIELHNRLVALAVFAKTRSPQLPAVPTFAEAGFPEVLDVNWKAWNAVLVKTQTPQAIVDFMVRAVDDILRRECGKREGQITAQAMTEQMHRPTRFLPCSGQKLLQPL